MELPSCPTAQAVEVASWAPPFVADIRRVMEGAPTTLATDTGSKILNSTIAEQWKLGGPCRQAQGAIIIDVD